MVFYHFYSINNTGNQRPPAAGGMRMAAGRDWGHLCWRPLILRHRLIRVYFSIGPAVLLAGGGTPETH
jgi:hypothetical protein